MTSPAAIQTDPNIVPILTSAQFPVGNDVTQQLAEGDSITDVVLTLVDVVTGVAVAGFSSSPTVTGNVISQLVDGALLTGGRSYRMTWTFQANTGKVVSSQTLIYAYTAP